MGCGFLHGENGKSGFSTGALASLSAAAAAMFFTGCANTTYVKFNSVPQGATLTITDRSYAVKPIRDKTPCAHRLRTSYLHQIVFEMEGYENEHRQFIDKGKSCCNSCLGPLGGNKAKEINVTMARSQAKTPPPQPPRQTAPYMPAPAPRAEPAKRGAVESVKPFPNHPFRDTKVVVPFNAFGVD